MDQLRICKRLKGNGYPSQQEADDKQIMEKKKSEIDNSNFHLFDLPELILHDILSRLPLAKICQFKSVCKTFFKILIDPYFSKVHLNVAPKTTPCIIIQENLYVSMWMLDLDLTFPSSSSSINAQTSTSKYAASTSRSLSLNQGAIHHHSFTQRNVKFCSFVSANMTTVGSCNGLLCLYYLSFPMALYLVSNPVLGEYMVLPPLIPISRNYTYSGVSGFGFSPKSKQYKIIRFMFKKSLDDNGDSTWKPMADIHTLGTQSWRSIEIARVPKWDGSFDACLNGTLHWITHTRRPCGLICSFDLHNEQFQVIPPPAHFESNYIKKISGINIGSIRGCLCVTYVSEDAQFTVWVMKEYGVKESWTNHFSIDINFYVGLEVKDFDCPIKFSHNGDLWLLCKSGSLVSYCPEKTCFKELSTFGTLCTQVIAHVPSLISLKNVVVDQNLEVEKCNQNQDPGYV